MIEFVGTQKLAKRAAIPERSGYHLCNYMKTSSIRVVLPFHLRTLARVSSEEVTVAVEPPVTQMSVLNALESDYPNLRGTIRDHGTLRRRPFIRFFACERDLSHESPESPLPEDVASGTKPFLIVGAIAGG